MYDMYNSNELREFHFGSVQDTTCDFARLDRQRSFTVHLTPDREAEDSRAAKTFDAAARRVRTAGREGIDRYANDDDAEHLPRQTARRSRGVRG